MAHIGYLFAPDFVRIGKERFAVKTKVYKAPFQKSENQVVNVVDGILRILLNNRAIDTKPVIIKLLAVNAKSRFKRLVFNCVSACGNVLHFTFADPFPHARNIVQPGIGF